MNRNDTHFPAQRSHEREYDSFVHDPDVSICPSSFGFSLSLYFSWSLIFKLNLLILKQISASIVIHVYLVTLRRRRVLHQNPRSPFWHNDEYNNLITKWKSANSGREKLGRDAN